MYREILSESERNIKIPKFSRSHSRETEIIYCQNNKIHQSSTNNKAMSKTTRSPSSSPTPTLDLTRKPIVLRNKRSFSIVSRNVSFSSSPFDQVSRTSLSESRMSFLEPRNSVSRVSMSSTSKFSPDFVLASDIPLSPSPICSISSGVMPLSSTSSFSSLMSANKNQFMFHETPDILSSQQMNWVTSFEDASLSSSFNQEISVEEEKLIQSTRSRRSSADGWSVKSISYTPGRSVRTHRRKFSSGESSTVSRSSSSADSYCDSKSPSTVSRSSSSADPYCDSKSMLDSPMDHAKRSSSSADPYSDSNSILDSPMGHAEQPDEISFSDPHSVPTIQSNPIEFMKRKGKGYFNKLLPGIRQKKVEVKLGDKKGGKSTEGKIYLQGCISQILRRKIEMEPDETEHLLKGAKSAVLYNILRKKEDSIEARRLKDIDLASKVLRETEKKLEATRLKALEKMLKKITRAEKKADESNAKVRQSTDKKEVVGKSSRWKSLFSHCECALLLKICTSNTHGHIKGMEETSM